MSNLLVSLKGSILAIHALIDPLVYQKRYASQSLKAKQKAVRLLDMDKESEERVKSLWGG